MILYTGSSDRTVSKIKKFQVKVPSKEFGMSLG